MRRRLHAIGHIGNRGQVDGSRDERSSWNSKGGVDLGMKVGIFVDMIEDLELSNAASITGSTAGLWDSPYGLAEARPITAARATIISVVPVQ